MVVDLFLEVIRNLFASTNHDLDEEVLKICHRDNVFEVLLHLSNQLNKKGNAEWNLVLLEIFFNLFRRFDATKELAKEEEEESKSSSGGELELKEVRSIIIRDVINCETQLLMTQKKRKTEAMKLNFGRHSRFGGLV